MNVKEDEKIIFGIDSNSDVVTEAGYDFREQYVYPYFKEKDFKILKAQARNAIRNYVKNILKTENGIKYITGVGHGEYNVYTGQNGEVIFKVDKYDKEEVNGKIVHLLSCVTAKELGTDFVKNGCKAFFGYEQSFVFNWKYREIFFQCDSEIDFAFADGLSADSVYTRTKDTYEEAIQELIDYDKDFIAAMLQDDLDILKCPNIGQKWGVKDATI